MKRTLIISYFLLILILVFPALGPGKSLLKKDTRLKTLESYLKKCEKYYTFSGSLLVAENSKIIIKKGLGFSNWNNKVPNTGQTKFMIGSLSKSFTAFVILQLINEAKINLESCVSEFLPYYPKDKGKKIKIKHLLFHSAGFQNISRLYPDFFTNIMKKEYTNQQFIRLFSDLELEFEPGARFSYSSAGYYLLAAIIEEVCGKKFHQVLRERIFAPLNMADSGSLQQGEKPAGMATGYDLWNYRYSKAEYTSPTAHKGAGSVYSTVEDLLKWYQSLHSGSYIPSGLRQKISESHFPINSRVGYGYGWAIGQRYAAGIGNLEFMEHGGSYNGFAANFSIFPKNKIVIILLANTTGDDVNQIRDQITNILYGKPYTFRIPVSFALDDCKNVSEIRDLVKEFKKNRSRYTIKLDMLNGLGLTKLMKKKYSLAAEILEFAVTEFTNSGWLYESLAEVYLKSGNKKQAIKNLKLCLKFDPKNRDAKRKLEKCINRPVVIDKP